MLELGRKETHLFSGIFVQIVLVGLLVFAYTQAVRQVNHGRELYFRYQEQLTMARDRMARRTPVPDLAALQSEVDQLKRHFATEPGLSQEGKWIEPLARDSFHLRGVHMLRTDTPVNLLTFPIEGRPDFEVELYGLELTATGTTRSVAALLATLAKADLQPILALAALDLKSAEPGTDDAVRISARWLVPVVAGPARGGEALVLAPSGVKPDWGDREEPFASPLRHAGALRMPAGKAGSLRLTGILWDPATPTCVINKKALRLREWVESYQVVLITPEAVLLQGLDEELLLHLS